MDRVSAFYCVLFAWKGALWCAMQKGRQHRHWRLAKPRKSFEYDDSVSWSPDETVAVCRVGAIRGAKNLSNSYSAPLG